MSKDSSQDWLAHPPALALLSEQMRATGRVLQQALRFRGFPRPFSQLLTRALHTPGKLLSRPVMHRALLESQDRWLWPLLALAVAAAASGAQIETLPWLSKAFWRRARVVAATSELLFTAADLIDDIQDGDSPFVQHIGAPQALCAGLACLELAPLVLADERKLGWSDAHTKTALETLHHLLLISLSGQFLDLTFERSRSHLTEAQVLEMTSTKSGALLALVCRLGALAGVASPERDTPDYYEAISQFGWQVGTWRQLLNDWRDAQPAPHPKSDRQRGKKTLPLFAQDGMMETHSPAQPDASSKASLMYTLVAAETYRLRAEVRLRSIEAQFGSHSLLWQFLADSETEPQEP